MEKAKGLIKDQQATIKDAAELCGYKDLAYFYRVFKNHFGITPGELRGEEK
ncbi:helix-turn-helix transcriptional regulator [Paenibacillus sp. MCAF20]